MIQGYLKQLYDLGHMHEGEIGLATWETARIISLLINNYSIL